VSPELPADVATTAMLQEMLEHSPEMSAEHRREISLRAEAGRTLLVSQTYQP
jgi:hypothetical protein